MVAEADNRPRVGLAVPGGGTGHLLALQSHYVLPGHAAQVTPILALSSAGVFNHNQCLAFALNMHRDGVLDYLVIHHADVQIYTPKWLDIMLEDQKTTGAAVLACVCSKKTTANGGVSNMAYATDCEFVGDCLHLSDIWALPSVFCQADTPHPERTLLVNTGLIMFDLSRPEWKETQKSSDGKDELKFCFRMHDRIVIEDNGNYEAQFAPEDWNFSKLCAAAGVPVYVTQNVRTVHLGEMGYASWREEEEKKEAANV